MMVRDETENQSDSLNTQFLKTSKGIPSRQYTFLELSSESIGEVEKKKVAPESSILELEGKT